MPIAVPEFASRLVPQGRRAVSVSVAFSALTLAGSVVLAGAGQPAGMDTMPHSGAWSVLQQSLPLLAAGSGLLAGVLGMLASVQAPASLPAGSAQTSIGGLEGVVRQLSDLLAEEHKQVAAFQESCGTSAQEALVVSRRLALLADVAMDAETRLIAGVARAEGAFRHPAVTEAGTGDTSPSGLSEITDIIRRSIIDQSRAIAASLDAMSARLVTEADGPIQRFRTTVSGASEQIKTLGDTSATLSRDVVAFETAGRGIASASAAVVSRLNDVVAHVDAALAQLPEAATAVVAAAEQAVVSISEETGGLQAIRQGMAEAAVAVRDETVALHETRQGVIDVIVGVHAEIHALQEVGQGIATSGGGVLSHINDGIARVDEALGPLPGMAEAVIASVGRAEQVLMEASRVLAGDSSHLSAAAQETLCITDALRQEIEALKVAGEAIRATGCQTIADVGQTAAEAAAQLGAVIADADIARHGTNGLAELAGRLEGVASTLVEGAHSLDAAGNRVAAAGNAVSERLVAESERHDQMLRALPEATAGMTAAIETMRAEASLLSAAVHHASAVGESATAAMAEAAVRIETSAAALDKTGAAIGTASHEVAAQIDHLAGIARYADAQAAHLPEVAAEIAAASARLQTVAEAWRPDALLTLLPEAAARLDAAAPRLDQLDGLSQRLEIAVAGLDAGQTQEAAVATMAVLSKDIGTVVHRIEAALASHEEAWPAVAASVDQLQAAAATVSRLTAEEQIVRGQGTTLDGVPPALAATLRHCDGVATESELLLQQTEALAEAVLRGNASDISPMLADRAPALLAGIEATTQRLRSVATALALASDGGPSLDRLAS
jgi:hypothetical protein